MGKARHFQAASQEEIDNRSGGGGGGGKAGRGLGNQSATAGMMPPSDSDSEYESESGEEGEEVAPPPPKEKKDKAPVRIRPLPARPPAPDAISWCTAQAEPTLTRKEREQLEAQKEPELDPQQVARRSESCRVVPATVPAGSAPRDCRRACRWRRIWSGSRSSRSGERNR